MSSSKQLAEIRARAEESILTPLSTVPQRPGSWMGGSSRAARVAELWPRRGDHFTEQIDKLWRCLESFDDWKQTWAVDHHNKVYTVMNVFSCYYVGGIFRKAMKLTAGGAMAFNTLAPCIVGSTIFGVYFHAREVLVQMALTPGGNHQPMIAKSTFFHTLTSVGYPLLFTPIASIYFASRYNTFAIPEDLVKSTESRNYLWNKIIRPTLIKHRNGLLLAALINAGVAATVTYFESEQIRSVYYDLAVRPEEPPPTAAEPQSTTTTE